MTTYGAYNAGLPCKNPSCKSHGKPHPNCQCYGPDMSEGGEVKSFCSENRMHQKGCEYYAEGGDVDLFAPPTAEEIGTKDEIKDVPADEPQQIDVMAPPTKDELKQTDLFAPPTEEEKKDYTTGGQQIAAHAEAVGRGLAGPVVPIIENTFGVPYQEQRAREEANPETKMTEVATTLGSVFLPFSLAKSALEIGQAAEATNILGKVGSKLLKGFLQTGFLGTGSLETLDNTSKYLLSPEKHDPSDALASIIGDSTMAGIFGIGGEALGLGAETAAQAMKIGTRFTNFMAGVGSESITNPKIKDLLDKKMAYDKFSGAYQNGKKFFNEILGSLGKLGANAGMIGSILENGRSIPAAFEGALMGYFGGLLGEQASKKAIRYTAPTIFKILASENYSGIKDVLNQTKRIAAGEHKLDLFLDNLMSESSKEISQQDFTKLKKQLNDKLEKDGGITGEIQNEYNNQPQPQGFAHGGEVEKPESMLNDPVAMHYPELNIIKQATKARALNYLNGLRPLKNAPRLAFDPEPHDPIKKRNYDKALTVAVNPMSVLHDIKHGKITPEQIGHLNAMYPEFSEYAKKKITEKIIHSQLSGEKPSYKVRQGLSLFMGTALSSEMQPQNIIAAQMTFQMQKSQPQQPQGQPKKKLSAIGHTDDHYLTPNQAAAGRQQKQA
jgi:hypothetical protein